MVRRFLHYLALALSVCHGPVDSDHHRHPDHPEEREESTWVVNHHGALASN